MSRVNAEKDAEFAEFFDAIISLLGTLRILLGVAPLRDNAKS